MMHQTPRLLLSWATTQALAVRLVSALQEDGSMSATSEATTTIHPDDIETGPTLGEILGVVTIVITIVYIFGISWKVIKIYRGDYEPQEPVYLKYK